MRAVHFAVLLASGGLLAACSEPPVTPASLPAAPSAPSSVSSSPAPVVSPPLTGPYAMSGLVYESVGHERRAVVRGFVDFLVNANSAWARVPLDTDGKYTISNLPGGSRLRVTAVADWRNGVLKQTCGAYAVVNGNTVRDVELVRLGTRGQTFAPPILSGGVFETTSEGRRPIVDTPVIYYSEYWATFDVYTVTDSQGRYEFCRLPRGSGLLGAGDCNDIVDIIPTEVTGDTNVLDVDLTSFNKSCPSTMRKRGGASLRPVSPVSTGWPFSSTTTTRTRSASSDRTR